MLDWLAEMLGLPAHFKFSEPGNGGGVIHGTASEATLVALLVARAKIMSEFNVSSGKLDANNNSQSGDLNVVQPATVQLPTAERLVGYCSDLAHSSVVRAGMLGCVRIKEVASDDNFQLRGDALKRQIMEDTEAGFVPFFVVATLGTTSVCSYDNLEEIGQVCRQFGLWLHVDAAYAGNSFVCPENRKFMKGIEVSHDRSTRKILPAAAATDDDCAQTVCRFLRCEPPQVASGQLRLLNLLHPRQSTSGRCLQRRSGLPEARQAGPNT